jgi:glycyl-tRNA synthetase
LRSRRPAADEGAHDPAAEGAADVRAPAVAVAEVVADRPRTVLRLHPRLAPVKAAVLPLVGNDPALVEQARRLYEELRRVLPAEYDASAAIGKRYRRQDEIGTPWALTIDQQTVEDGTVTLRDRDTLAQERVPIGGVKPLLLERLGS